MNLLLKLAGRLFFSLLLACDPVKVSIPALRIRQGSATFVTSPYRPAGPRKALDHGRFKK